MTNIDFFFEDMKSLSIQKSHIIRHIKDLIINELKEIGDINIIFCSDKYLLEMNKQYLNHDYYTDIITFDNVEGNIISGDLFISYDRILDNSQKLDNELINELYRVIFHGILHLVGYYDKTDDEKRKMTEKENFYLNRVDFTVLGKLEL